MNALKPCPFCGGTAEIVPFANPPKVSAKCQSCPAEIGGWRYTDPEKKANAAAVTEAWNRRIETTADKEKSRLEPAR